MPVPGASRLCCLRARAHKHRRLLRLFETAIHLRAEKVHEKEDFPQRRERLPYLQTSSNFVLSQNRERALIRRCIIHECTVDDCRYKARDPGQFLMTSLKLVAATTPNSRTPLHPVQPAQGKSEAYKWLFIAGKRGGSNKGCVASLGMNRTARQKSGKTRPGPPRLRKLHSTTEHSG